jgi:hypothetical protein
MIGSRSQRGSGTLPVGIGNLQQELAAGFDDIGDAGRKHTFFTGQLFVNFIGNAVAGGTQLLVAGDKGLAAEHHAFLRIVKAEARFHPAIRAATQAAGSQCIGALGFPVAVIDRRIFVERSTGRVDQLEQATTVEVGTHGGGDDAGGGWVAAEISNGDRDTVGASAGNFDGKLGLGNCYGQQRKSHKNSAGYSVHCLHFQ